MNPTVVEEGGVRWGDTEERGTEDCPAILPPRCVHCL